MTTESSALLELPTGIWERLVFEAKTASLPLPEDAETISFSEGCAMMLFFLKPGLNPSFCDGVGCDDEDVGCEEGVLVDARRAKKSVIFRLPLSDFLTALLIVGNGDETNEDDVERQG